MPTIEQTKKISADRLEEICSWAFQANMRFTKGNYQTCLGALDNVVKVAKEAITLVKSVSKERDKKKNQFLKTIKKPRKKKTGLSGKGKRVKSKRNGKSKRNRKSAASRNKKAARKV
jgi:hypothetical protein